MISVIIPNFNDIRIINAVSKIVSCDSIMEILIVDGKSTDAQVLNYYKTIEDPKVKVLKYNDSGIFDAINYGVLQSKGKVIYLQGTDDIVSDVGVFDHVVQFLTNNDSFHGYCMGCKFVNGENQTVREWMPDGVSRNKILLGILPPHFSLFLRKDVYSVIGDFETSSSGDLSLDSLWLIKMGVMIENLKIHTNNEYWLNMALGGLSTGSVGVVLRQNLRLLELLRGKIWKPKAWFLIPVIKVVSKLFQINIINKVSFLSKSKSK